MLGVSVIIVKMSMYTNITKINLFYNIDFNKILEYFFTKECKYKSSNRIVS